MGLKQATVIAEYIIKLFINFHSNFVINFYIDIDGDWLLSLDLYFMGTCE